MGSNTEAPLLLVDGFNLLHAVILQGRDRANWWNRDNQARVVQLVSRYNGPEICQVVFDAARADSVRLEIAAGEGVVYAPSADDWIVQQVEQRKGREVTVVSADRSLVDQAKRCGAARMSPWQFAEKCVP